MSNCNIKIPTVSTVCGNLPYRRLYIPDKYKLRLKIEGFVDIPEDELMPGNMYATKTLRRIYDTNHKK